MSRQETHTGKIKPVNGTLKSLLEKLNIEVEEGSDYHEMLDRLFDEDYYKKYIVIDENTIYEVIEDKEIHDDISMANKNEDETISYIISYYNGGCSFDEAIKKAIGKISTTPEKSIVEELNELINLVEDAVDLCSEKCPDNRDYCKTCTSKKAIDICDNLKRKYKL